MEKTKPAMTPLQTKMKNVFGDSWKPVWKYAQTRDVPEWAAAAINDSDPTHARASASCVIKRYLADTARYLSKIGVSTAAVAH